MPEGDTIHKLATRLRPALVGATLDRFDAPRLAGPAPALGTEITAVDAVGKHLLITFGDGTTLETHLRMTGSWHLYRTGERWRKPAHLARVVIGAGDTLAVCFSAPVVRSHRDGGRRALAHLGPDLCRPTTGDPTTGDAALLDEVLDRLVQVTEPGTALAEVLLDQRIASGIGNVYATDLCWLHRLHPSTPIEAVDDDTRRRLYATATELLRANLTTRRRTTVPGGLAVYGKARRPCRRCGTPIRTGRVGVNARVSFWCPRCQPPPARADRTTPGR